MIELPDHPWFVAGQFHPEFRSRPTRPHPLFRDFVGAATAFADDRDRAAAAPAPGVRSDGVPAYRNGGEPIPAPDRTPAPAPVPASAGSSPQAPAETAVPRVPIVDANPVPPEPTEPPVTVDLRGDGLADPVRHDDDPPVPAGPLPTREPGRP
jgi:hypothetical protein